MATLKQQNEFIAEIAPLIVEQARTYGYKTASTIIAQACIESAYGNGWSRRNNNYFGIKYGSWTKRTNIASQISVVQAKTNEEYKIGQLTTIIDGFCKCPDMKTGVILYFEFLRVNPRYRNLKQCGTANSFAAALKADGYATSSTYVQTLNACVARLNLERYDNWTTENTTTEDKPKQDLNKARILKVHSAGDDVKILQAMLKACGYDCGTVDGAFGTKTFSALCSFQKSHGLAVDGVYGPRSRSALVTAYNARTGHKSTDTIAREVIKGLWGNGEERKKKLREAGYNPEEVQKKVNALS